MSTDSIVYSSDPEVTLEEVMGDDLAIVNAARVSFVKRSSWLDTKQRLLKEADAGLINYLMRERHGTPFEMVQFRFRVRTSIRVMREWQRHRIGGYNEVSTRYVEMKPEFFVPDLPAVRVQTGKPGHYVMETASSDVADVVIAAMRRSHKEAWEHYQNLLSYGVAKELAAYVLPLGTYTEQIWSVNLRSAFNFLSLRNAATALREIRHAAVLVEQKIEEVVPYAYRAFNECGRHSP